MPKPFSIKPIIRFFILGILLIPACQTVTPIPPTIQSSPQTTAPTEPPPPLASPTSPGPRSIPPVPPEQTESAGTITNQEGIAAFDDSISGYQLNVEFQDQNTQTPVSDIQVWFVSNGPKVLVLAHDPSGEYVNAVQEVLYEDLFTSSSRGKLASPNQLIPLPAIIALIKFVDLYQDFWKWKAFVEDFPSLEDWQNEELTFCVNPEQAKKGIGLAADIIIGRVAKKLSGIGDKELEEALEKLFGELLEQENEEFVEAYGNQITPSIIRFRVLSFKGIVPQILQIDGFCLNPLNRSDPQSALDWIVYGIENEDIYTFKQLVPSNEVVYSHYIEGGEFKPPVQFLQELEMRLPDGPACKGYTSEYGDIQIWTEGWVQEWVMTELCYEGCQQLDPPWRSSNLGFILRESEEQWSIFWLHLDTPDNFFFTENFQMNSCSIPYEFATSANPLYPSPTPGLSCPGAPLQRMVVDQRGYVCTQSDRIVVRSGPGRSNDEVTRLDSGTLFTVTGGPSCANDWSWWEIRTDDGLIGWISEGGDSVDPYFICPLP